MSGNGDGPAPDATGMVPHRHVAYGPLTTGVVNATGPDGTPLVLLCLEGQNGSFRFVLDQAHARNLANRLLESSGTNLSVPPVSVLRKLPPPPSRP